MIFKFFSNTCTCCCIFLWKEAEALVCQRRFIFVWGSTGWQKQGRGGNLIVATVAPHPKLPNTFEVVNIVWSTINHFDVSAPKKTCIWAAKADSLWSSLVDVLWVITIQPPRVPRVASVGTRIWSRHLCPCLAFKAIPTGNQSTVTFSWLKGCFVWLKGCFSISVSEGFVVLTT